ARQGSLRGSQAPPCTSGSHRSGPRGGRASSHAPTRATSRSPRRCRASPPRSSSRWGLRLPAVRPLGVIGPLSGDVVAGSEPRIGGGPWHAARALRALDQSAVVVAKCGDDERASFLRRLASLGIPVALVCGGETTAFSFSYDAEKHRTMHVDALG